MESVAALPLGKILGEGAYGKVALLHIPAAPPLVVKLFKARQNYDLQRMALAEADSLDRVTGVEGVPRVYAVVYDPPCVIMS